MIKRITLKPTTSVVLLSLFIISEILFTTFLRNKWLSPSANGIVLFLFSLLIGLFPFFFKGSVSGKLNHSAGTYIPKYIWFFLLTLNFLFWVRYIHLNPVRVNESDIIPTIELLVKRQQAGIFPYKIITEWGYDLQPTYLPLTWMPFHLTEFMIIDYRYLVFASWLLFCLYLYKRHFADNKTTYGQILLFLLFQAVFWMFLFYGDLTFVRTVELMIATYYCFFLFSLEKKNTWLIALSLLVCLLSRYSLAMWVPFFFLLSLKDLGLKQTAKWSVLVVAGIVFLYILPFLSTDFSVFFRGLKGYASAAAGEWKGQSWQAVTDKPFQLFRGTGLAAYFYDHSQGTVEQKIDLYKNIHLVSVVLITLILCGWYFLTGRKQKFYMPLIAAASLKIYFSFFYGFIMTPYVYLFIVPVITSLIVLYYFMQQPEISQSSF